MCLAVVKPRGEDIQKFKDKMRIAFSQNSDGAGFAISKEKTVLIKKGYMNFDDFWEAFSEDCSIDDTALLHFRLATAGSVCAENCHPYPITGDTEKLLMTEVECKAAGVHNGIFSQFNEVAKKMNISDTLAFLFKFNKELVLAHNDDNIMELLEAYVGTWNKVAILFPGDEFYTLGSWKEKDGILFSNLNFDWSYVGTTGYSHLFDDVDDVWASEVVGSVEGKSETEDMAVVLHDSEEIDTEKYCPICEKELDVADYCSWCGWSGFCLNCGKALDTEEERFSQVCDGCGFRQPDAMGRYKLPL